VVAQYLSMLTATRQSIEMVHNTTRTETVNKHPYRFLGSPTLAKTANGIPSKPTRKSAIARAKM